MCQELQIFAVECMYYYCYSPFILPRFLLTSWSTFFKNIHFGLMNSDVSNFCYHPCTLLWILIFIFLRHHTRRLCHFTDHYYDMSFYVHGSSNLNDNSLPCLPRNLLHAYHLVLCFVTLFPAVLYFMHSLSNLLLSFFTACKIFLPTKYTFLSAL